ncbi:MAG: hypothetical protein ACXV2I_01685 [Actinomycetes bacterium]
MTLVKLSDGPSRGATAEVNVDQNGVFTYAGWQYRVAIDESVDTASGPARPASLVSDR